MGSANEHLRAGGASPCIAEEAPELLQVLDEVLVTVTEMSLEEITAVITEAELRGLLAIRPKQ